MLCVHYVDPMKITIGCWELNMNLSHLIVIFHESINLSIGKLNDVFGSLWNQMPYIHDVYEIKQMYKYQWLARNWTHVFMFIFYLFINAFTTYTKYNCMKLTHLFSIWSLNSVNPLCTSIFTSTFFIAILIYTLEKHNILLLCIPNTLMPQVISMLTLISSQVV